MQAEGGGSWVGWRAGARSGSRGLGAWLVARRVGSNARRRLRARVEGGGGRGRRLARRRRPRATAEGEG